MWRGRLRLRLRERRVAYDVEGAEGPERIAAGRGNGEAATPRGSFLVEDAAAPPLRCVRACPLPPPGPHPTPHIPSPSPLAPYTRTAHDRRRGDNDQHLQRGGAASGWRGP